MDDVLRCLPVLQRVVDSVALLDMLAAFSRMATEHGGVVTGGEDDDDDEDEEEEGEGVGEAGGGGGGGQGGGPGPVRRWYCRPQLQPSGPLAIAQVRDTSVFVCG